MKRRCWALIGLVLCIALLVGCGETRKIRRILQNELEYKAEVWDWENVRMENLELEELEPGYYRFGFDVYGYCGSQAMRWIYGGVRHNGERWRISNWSLLGGYCP